jgi:RimJ/RimL family protein N-acetyltransferase
MKASRVAGRMRNNATPACAAARRPTAIAVGYARKKPPLIVLETDRLVLRRLTLNDAPFILELLNEPSFLRFIGDRGVKDLQSARQYLLKGPIASYEKFGFGLYLAFLKESGDPIGMCGLLKRETLPDVDLGFAFLPAYWRKGFAFESASAVLDHGRRAFGLKRIVAITSPDNLASIGVLEKVGLKFEGLTRLGEDPREVKLFAAAL